MSAAKTLILNSIQINQKIDRLAYQVYENNAEEDNIVIAGITGRGYILAKRIADRLRKISKIKVELVEVTVDKDNPLKQEIKLSTPVKNFKGKVVILVDDVLKSGKTLIYGLEPFLEIPLKRITTLVLVDRNHNRYPIKADLVGLSMATTLQEHISVELDKEGKEAVYLM